MADENKLDENKPVQQKMLSEPKRTRATVAPNRTIVGNDPGALMVIGHDVDGKPIKRARPITFGPGQEIELETGEVARLRKSGFLVDPSATQLPRGEGPSFTEVGRVAA